MSASRHSFLGVAGPASRDDDLRGTRATRSYFRRRLKPHGKGAGRRVAAALLAFLTIVGTLPPARADVDPAAVQRSIDRGIAYLKRTQTERGAWAEYRGQSCGLSALCTLALLNAGVERDDPAMVRALRYLRGFQPEETYSVALQTLAYCQAGAAGDLPRIGENVKWLWGDCVMATTSRGRTGNAIPMRYGNWSGTSNATGDAT